MIVPLDEYAGDLGVKGKGLLAAQAMGLRIPPTFVLGKRAFAPEDASLLRATWRRSWIIRPSAVLEDDVDGLVVSGWLESPVAASVDDVPAMVRRVQIAAERSVPPELGSARTLAPPVVVLLQPFYRTRLSGLLHSCDDFLGVRTEFRATVTDGHLSRMTEGGSGWDVALRVSAAGDLELVGTAMNVRRCSSPRRLESLRALVKIGRVVHKNAWIPVEIEWIQHQQAIVLLQMQRLVPLR